MPKHLRHFTNTVIIIIIIIFVYCATQAADRIHTKTLKTIIIIIIMIIIIIIRNLYSAIMPLGGYRGYILKRPTTKTKMTTDELYAENIHSNNCGNDAKNE